jgi:PAS domain S-box-containing protein
VSGRARGPLVLATAPPAWLERLPGATLCHPAALDGMDVTAFSAAFIEASSGDPLATARRLREADPSLQPILVAERAAELRRLERALLFSPGLGELWLIGAAEVDADLLERAAAVTGQRRRYRGTRVAVARGMRRTIPLRAERTLVSDAFLAVLLEVLPDPVLSLDPEGRVLSLNPAAERAFGWTRARAVGRPATEVLRPRDPGRFLDLLEAGRVGPVRGELVVGRDGDEKAITEVAVAPARASGLEVRALVLHDVTRQRAVQAELETQAAELENAAAELEMLNAGLEERTVQLEEAQATRSRFYAAMSHELRTPINAIIGYDDLILEGIYGPVDPRQAEALRRGRRAAEHLLELVNDVLDLSKIEAGRIELELESTDLGELFQEMVHTVRPLADEHGTRLEVRRPAGGSIVTDPRRVRQILLNLLSNAIKFGDGKPVEVSATLPPGGGAEVAVRDRGPGIHPADQERIFEEFVQLGDRAGTGTGLGLPISRRLATLLGGSLSVHSAPGLGSTFTLRLPPSAG